MNPLIWLGLRPNGNPKAIPLMAGGLIVCVAVFGALSYSLVPRKDWPSLDQGWLLILSIAQGLFLITMAPGAIRKAILRDFQTGMMESHRLSPISSMGAVLGYLIGAALPAMILYATAVVLSGFFAARFGVAPGLPTGVTLQLIAAGWGFGHICLLIASLLICSTVLLVSIASRGKVNVIGAIILASIFGGWVVLVFVPGLSLLTGLLSIGSLAGMIFGGAGGPAAAADPSTLFVTCVLQVLLAVLFLNSASRKFRSPERSLFSLWGSFALLFLTGATLVAGMGLQYRHAWFFSDWRDMQDGQFLASAATFMLVSLFAVIAASSERFHEDRVSAFSRASLSRSAKLARLAPLVLAIMMLAVCYFMAGVSPVSRNAGARLSGPDWVPVAVTLYFSYIIDTNLTYALIARGRKLLLPLLIALVLLRGLPLAVGGIAQAFADEVHMQTQFPSLIMCISPLGVLAVAGSASVVWIGIGIQALISFLVLRWAARVRRTLLQDVAANPSPLFDAGSVATGG